MLPSVLLPVANHLWQSTLFAGLGGLLTLALRNNHAHARYCLWLAASAKFLVPFSLLVLVGSQFGGPHRTGPPRPSSVPAIIEQVNEPFVSSASIRPTPAPHNSSSSIPLVPILFTVWASGSLALGCSWWIRGRRVRAALRAASPVPLAIGVPVFTSASIMEPGVFGVLRPVLLLPDGIAGHLSSAEFRAILAHELTHVRRRDNLATLMHMLVEAIFWFHPLVWWLGSRLIQERERACDEEVLRSGSQPQTYAEGILKVCELYLASPLNFVAGVTGANLKQRIEAIMRNAPMHRLNFAKKAGLAVVGAGTLAIPLILGITNAPQLRAQADPNLRFEAASVRRVEIPNINGRVPISLPEGGVGTADPHRFSWRGAQIVSLIGQTFGVQGDLIQMPKGIGQDRYDILVSIPDGATKEQFNVMMGNLLRDRLHLRFHMESKVLPVYALRVAKGGPKLKEFDSTRRPDTSKTPASRLDEQGFPILLPGQKGAARPRPGEIFMSRQDTTMAELAQAIADPPTGLGRHVIDETGLTRHYDFKLHMQWGRQDPDNPTGAASVFTALQEQLGLKLEPSTALFDHLIIDSLDREPSDN